MWLAIKTAKSDIVLNFDCKCLTFKSSILVYLIPLENMTEQETMKAKSAQYYFFPHTFKNNKTPYSRSIAPPTPM